MKKLIVIVTVLLICMSIVIGCGTPAITPVQPAAPATPAPATPVPAPAPTTPQYGGVLRNITGQGPGSPIGWPPESSGINSWHQQVSMDFLLIEDIKGDMQPYLATSYEVNSDPANPSITFHLRKGVKFQDGTDFNAQAVKWDFEQVKEGKLNVSVTSVWKSFDVLDDYTIRVNLTKWQNHLLRSFNTSAAMIFSPAAYEKNGVEWMRWHMVGTGAFKQEDFAADEHLLTTKNENYWEPGKPYLDGIELVYVADAMTRVALFKSGGGEVLGCTPQEATELKDLGYQIITRQRNTNILIPDSVNADSPWSNLKVRQAAEYAIDKDAINKAFGYGFYEAAYQVAPPTSGAYVPTIVPRKYDPEKAKQLLTEAGYPSGFKTKIIGGPKDIDAAYQSYLAAVGIDAELEFPDFAKVQQYFIGGTWNNALLDSGVVLYANFNNVLATWFGVPSNFYKSMKKPDGYADLFNASVNAPEPDPVLMQKCIQAFYDDVTVIPTRYDTNHWAITDKVHDTGIGKYGSFTMWSPQNAWLSK